MKKLQIELGPLAPTLQEQTGVNTEEMERREIDHRAIVRCHVQGYMSDAQYQRALRHLVRRVEVAINNH